MPDLTAGFGLAHWLALFLAAAVGVVLAGIALARTGDEIAHRTGLGGLVVGTFLLAAATSLPELATDMSAAYAGAPDLAVGDLFGSSMANMAILAVLDLAHRGRVWTRVSLGHARLAGVAIALTSIALLAMLVPRHLVIGWVGAETVVIAAGYVAVSAWIHRTRRGGRRERDATGEMIAPIGAARDETAGIPLRSVFLRFAGAAGVVLLLAPVVAVSGKGIATETGIGETFIGTLLLAATTSLPELVAALTAIHIGAHDLAVGNLFGSNAFNMTALLAVDVAYTPGPVLAAVAPAQAVAGVGAILLMAVALMAVVHGAETRIARLEPDAVTLLVLYAALLVAVWVAAA